MWGSRTPISPRSRRCRAYRPTARKPTHPRAVLPHEFLQPLEFTQRDLAIALDVPFQRVNEIVRGKRGATPSTALRLATFLGTSPDVWTNLQLRWDLYGTQQAEADHIANIRPLQHAGTGNRIPEPLPLAARQVSRRSCSNLSHLRTTSSGENVLRAVSWSSVALRCHPSAA